MKKWLDHVRDNYMVDYIVTRDYYGDWCMPPELPELIHSQDPGAEDQWRTVEHLHLLLSHRNYGPIRRAYRKHRRHCLFRGAGHRYPGGLQPEVL